MKKTVKPWIIIAGLLIFSVVVGGNIGVAFDLVILLLLCLILPVIWGMKLIARWFGADLEAQGPENWAPSVCKQCHSSLRPLAKLFRRKRRPCLDSLRVEDLADFPREPLARVRLLKKCQPFL